MLLHLASRTLKLLKKKCEVCVCFLVNKAEFFDVVGSSGQVQQCLHTAWYRQCCSLFSATQIQIHHQQQIILKGKENQSSLVASHMLDLCKSSLISGFNFFLYFEMWSQPQFILPYTAVWVRAQGWHPQQPWGSGTLFSWLMQEALPLCWNRLDNWCTEWGK